MRNKTANNLLKILKLLIAEDVETVELGIGLFAINPILTNIPKNKRFELSDRWPVNYKPTWGYDLNTRSNVFSNYTDIYTKTQFINILHSENISLSRKVTLILNFCILVAKGFFNRRDKNHKLSFYIQQLDNNDNIINGLTPSKRYVIKDYYPAVDRCLFPAHPYFSEELSDLGIKNNFDCLSVIRDYKFFLQLRYNKTETNKARRMFIELADQYCFTKGVLGN